jgi:hypothetical protein
MKEVSAMEHAESEVDAEKAVERAFEFFDRFVARGSTLESVLLEELEPTDNGWIVSIGFNGKREETSEPVTASAFGALGNLGTRTTRVVREVRHIFLDKTGKFLKMS